MGERDDEKCKKNRDSPSHLVTAFNSPPSFTQIIFDYYEKIFKCKFFTLVVTNYYY